MPRLAGRRGLRRAGALSPLEIQEVDWGAVMQARQLMWVKAGGPHPYLEALVMLASLPEGAGTELVLRPVWIPPG